MSEHELYEDLITGAFESFIVAAAPSVRAAGAGAVRTTVHRRRRVRNTALSVLGALLIGVPLLVFAANPRGSDPAPGPAGSPSPSVSPSAATAPPPPPDGRINEQVLTAAPIDVPAWVDSPPGGCASGRVRVVPPGQGTGNPPEVRLKQVVYANLDADDALETAAVLLCGAADPTPEQVVAYDRDPSGDIVLIGRIYGQTDDVEYTKTIAARSEGGLKVTVCAGRCGSDPPPSSIVDREYVWNGRGFSTAK